MCHSHVTTNVASFTFILWYAHHNIKHDTTSDASMSKRPHENDDTAHAKRLKGYVLSSRLCGRTNVNFRRDSVSNLESTNLQSTLF